MAIKQEKIYIGQIDNENIYITKHSWDCDWYWGFGYLGNRNRHFHIESLICVRDDNGKYPSTEIADIFTVPVFTQNQWWIIRDLFIQAYSIRKCAEVFRYGGNQTHKTGITDILKNTMVKEVIDNEIQDEKFMENVLNEKLKLILDTAWQFMLDSIEENKPKDE